MLILLDIDGVMVSGASWKRMEILADGFSAFSSKAVSSLKQIMLETNCSIVLTTSHKSRYSIPEWENIFKARGITIRISTLNENTNGLSRKDEIMNWFKSKRDNEEYVIIDDDKSLNELPMNIKERLVLTDSTIGLDEYYASKVIAIMKSSGVIIE